MKKNLKSKIIFSIILILTIFTILGSLAVSNAATAAPNPEQYVGTNMGGSMNSLNNIGNQIITVVSTIGSIGAVIVLVVLGIKYMIGSTEEKAEYKKTLMPYVIGAALIFAASTLSGIIFNVFSNL